MTKAWGVKKSYRGIEASVIAVASFAHELEFRLFLNAADSSDHDTCEGFGDRGGLCLNLGTAIGTLAIRYNCRLCRRVGA